MAQPYGLDLDSVQADILAHAKTLMPAFEVQSGGIPDAENLTYVDGVLKPYIVLNFADLMPAANDRAFGGAKWDGYYSYVNIFAVAPGDALARQVLNQMRNKLLGYVGPNTSELKPAPGGGTFALPDGRDAPIPYTALATLQFNTNVTNVATSRFDS